MNEPAQAPSARAALASALAARVPQILEQWRARLQADPALTTHRGLPRAQLFDHLPDWLQALGRRIAAGPEGWQRGAADAEQEHNALAHGLQRWQLGFDLSEVTREWGALHLVLSAELPQLVAGIGDAPPGLLAEAFQALAAYVAESTSDSASEYFRLARIEAAGALRDLEDALGGLREVERQQAELWQQAAHDLRGNLGVVSNVAEGLIAGHDTAQGLPPAFLQILRRNLTSLHTLLDDVTELARLQAGELRREGAFDAAELLRDLADAVRPLATSRELALVADGLPALPVQGDAVKVRRVAQNLLLNALKYTDRGSVTVRWGAAADDAAHWWFTVADTGPGFNAGPGTPLVAEMKAEPGTPPEVDPRPPQPRHGEGLGLAIVKRLCDLLDASVDVESTPAGTTFRVTLPVEPTRRGPGLG